VPSFHTFLSVRTPQKGNYLMAKQQQANAARSVKRTPTRKARNKKQKCILVFVEDEGNPGWYMPACADLWCQSADNKSHCEIDWKVINKGKPSERYVFKCKCITQV
jgi:hypothetical protein